MWDGNAKESKLLDSPADCKSCTEEDRRHFGCGEWAGKGEYTEWDFPRGLTDEWVKHTCPRWCLTLPEVLQAFADRDDYDRGALGCVLDMDAAYLECLRAASLERKIWDSEMQRQVSSQ